MSQFDTLLDFDSTSGNGTVQTSNDFDLDPFGGSPSVEMKGGSDFDLLGDLGFTGQTSVTTNCNTNGDSVNPLYQLSMDQDMSASDNLIMTDDLHVSQKSTKSANPLYDLENGSSEEPSANPLYELSENTADTNGHNEDLLGTGTTDDSGVTMGTETSNEGDNLLLSTGSQDLKFEVRRDESHESMNGISDEDSELVEKLTDMESQEILQNQSKESVPEQTQITFDDQTFGTEAQSSDKITLEEQAFETPAQNIDIVVQGSDEQEDQNLSVETKEEVEEENEPEVLDGDQDNVEETEVITQEVVEVYESEILDEDQGEQENIEETEVIVQEVVEDVQTKPEEQEYSEDAVETIVDTADVITEENVTTEQEVIPTEEFSSASEDQKETTVKESSKGQAETKKGDIGVIENGLDNEVYRESQEKEEVSFDQMSSIRNKLESNKGEDEVIIRERKKSVHEEIADAEGGEYENEPTRNPDVVRESDKDIGQGLPEVGTAKNILEKFKQIETTPKTYKKETTPPEARKPGKVEYVSEPKPGIENEAQKIEGGIFENQPVQEEGVVHSYDHQEETLPEKGYAKNILEKFKQIGTTSGDSSPHRRELTPDRNTKYEYVSEPRSVMEKYEGKVESGIFESQPKEDLPDIIRSGMSNEEVMPEKGTARNLASRYKEISDQAALPQSSERKRELTPDKTGKVEYVSEPRSTLPKYEGKSEVGVFESQPEGKEEIVKSDMHLEEILPEKGSARNIAARFREIESSPSPSSSPKPKYKEVTPPRDDVDGKTVAGVLESTPAERGDVVKGSEGADFKEEELPERGMAKNIANKFKQYQQSAPSPSRGKKEFTPPPEGGVFENTPQPSLQVEVRQAESGILESTPSRREDVAREDSYSAGDVEFPEEGYAKNMVSKWRNLETQSGKTTPSPKHREFTPPRDYPMSPKSPAGVDTSVKPSDLPGQYQEQKGYGGVFENRPQALIGVAREGETDVTEELPEKDAAKSMVQKFKAIQEQAKKSEEAPKPKSRKDSSDSIESPVTTSKKMFESSAESPKGSFVPVQLEKCAACQKTVYAMEKLEMNKHIYHRACFKCSHCKCVLTPKTFSMNEGVIFCTNHFKQLFARKGNYDEGFGRQQYKKKWGGADNNEEQ